VVTSTAAQLPNANGAVGGPLVLPAGPGKYATTSTVRVKTQGAGTYACALQVSTGGSFFDVDRVKGVSTNVLHFAAPSGSFLNQRRDHSAVPGGLQRPGRARSPTPT